jgi:hypothetical protein
LKRISTEASSYGFDFVKAQTFTEKFLTALHCGALCLMASIGQRTGLLGAMGILPASPVKQTAHCLANTQPFFPFGFTG